MDDTWGSRLLSTQRSGVIGKLRVGRRHRLTNPYAKAPGLAIQSRLKNIEDPETKKLGTTYRI